MSETRSNHGTGPTPMPMTDWLSTHRSAGGAPWQLRALWSLADGQVKMMSEEEFARTEGSDVSSKDLWQQLLWIQSLAPLVKAWEIATPFKQLVDGNNVEEFWNEVPPDTSINKFFLFLYDLDCLSGRVKRAPELSSSEYRKKADQTAGVCREARVNMKKLGLAWVVDDVCERSEALRAYLRLRHRKVLHLGLSSGEIPVSMLLEELAKAVEESEPLERTSRQKGRGAMELGCGFIEAYRTHFKKSPRVKQVQRAFRALWPGHKSAASEANIEKWGQTVTKRR